MIPLTTRFSDGAVFLVICWVSLLLAWLILAWLEGRRR